MDVSPMEQSCPALSHSPTSGWPICILPASPYAYSNDVSITLHTVAPAITTSFNKLSTSGLKIYDLPSCGGDLEFWISLRSVS